MRFLFALFTLALSLAVLSGLALAWDGAYALFVLLDTQSPYAAYGRFTDLALRIPALIASQFTARPELLQTIFALPYAAIPLVALLASWWIVRGSARSLFIWAVLVIGLVTLPGQACFVCQADSVVQLFMPILLALAIGMPRRALPLVGILSALIFFFHPSVIPLFAFAAVVAGLMGWRLCTRRRVLWGTALAFALASAIGEARFLLASNSYELGQLSLRALAPHLLEGLVGLPLVALVYVGFAALLIAVQPFTATGNLTVLSHSIRKDSLDIIERAMAGIRPVSAYVPHVAFATLIMAGLVLFIWAISPQRWALALGFRQFVLLCSLPFMLLVVAEAWVHAPAQWQSLRAVWPYRRRMAQATALIFFTVLAAQSLVWQDLTGRLSTALTDGSPSCLNASELAWLRQTPLDDWTITARSLVMQGQTPQRIVMPREGCATESFLDGLPLAIFDPGDWDLRDWQMGWFDVRAVGVAMVAQQLTPPSCRYPMTAGWYGVEVSGAHWWRWINGRAVLHVQVAQDVSATLNGAINSYPEPNRARVSVNGTGQTEFDVTHQAFLPFPPLVVSLHRGENTIEFASDRPAVRVPGDGRTLAIALKDLRLTTSDGVEVCH